MAQALLSSPVAVAVAPVGPPAAGPQAPSDSAEPGAFARELDRASAPSADAASEPAAPRGPAEPASGQGTGPARPASAQRTDWLHQQRLVERRLAQQRVQREADHPSDAAGDPDLEAADGTPAASSSAAKADTDLLSALAGLSPSPLPREQAPAEPAIPLTESPAPGTAAESAAGLVAAAAHVLPGVSGSQRPGAEPAADPEAARAVGRRSTGPAHEAPQPGADDDRSAAPIEAAADPATGAKPAGAKARTAEVEAFATRAGTEAEADARPVTSAAATGHAAATPLPASDASAPAVVVAPVVASQTAAAGASETAPAHATMHELKIAVPVEAPGFAARFGEEISVLARGGVQEARVHLHPAEWGPITVQITLDGLGAQVHLAAVVAETRQALEQAMPSLAASLRESGLTLTGGGVFEQPRPRDQSAESSQPGSHAADRDRDAEDDDAPVLATLGATVRSTRLRGGLDLYA